MVITKEQIDLLRGVYIANKEDLKQVEEDIEAFGETDDGVSNATESFEQGYNNALEYVFKALGIEL